MIIADVQETGRDGQTLDRFVELDELTELASYVNRTTLARADRITGHRRNTRIEPTPHLLLKTDSFIL